MSTWTSLPSTLQELEAYPQDTLTVAVVGKVLKADPQTLRLQARQRPDLLGFPVIVAGTRVKIPKDAFLRYMRGMMTNRKEEAL